MEPKFLAPGNLGVMIDVTHHKAEGAPWGALAIFVLGVPGGG